MKENQWLEPFGAAVLQAMQDSEEWSGDTFEEFQAAADELGLVGVDRNGFLKRKFIKGSGTTNLSRFGAQVLDYMAGTEDWDPGDIDIFAEVAVSGGLATIRRGRFIVTKKGLRMDVPDPRASARKDVNPRTIRTRRGDTVTASAIPTAREMDLGDVARIGDLKIAKRHGAYIVNGYIGNRHVSESFRTYGRALAFAKRESVKSNPLASGAPVPAVRTVNRGAALMT